ncbi:MAG: hypothetical protein MR689_10265, partial [Bacteroidales bacterium]|nr:hypothetical protein [Bacteroidales bacterium]
PQLKQFPHKKAFSQKPGKRLYRRHFFPKKTPLALKNPPKTRIFSVLSPLACFQCADKLLFAAKHGFSG